MILGENLLATRHGHAIAKGHLCVPAGIVLGSIWQAARMTGDGGSLLEGVYESLITKKLNETLATLEGVDVRRQPVADADEPEVLSRHVRQAVLRALRLERSPERRLALVNEVLDVLAAEEDRVIESASQLISITAPPQPGHPSRSSERPATPFSDAALLTNASGEPGIGAELRAEIPTADRVDVIMAFVKWHGIRVIERQLLQLRERGVPFRLITTTYMGATERAALDRLVREFGAEVKVQYDSLRTRLHAKAWLLRRETGFDTAYVGSSNLSRSALLDGVEWNVRLSAVATPSLIEKFQATFDSYWNDQTFESYDPDNDADRLDDALAEASWRKTHERVTLSLSGLEVRPYPHQTEMLERLDVERVVHGRHRNLLVAATGTGKTVIAALDYRRLANREGRRPSLLFVAHRREILEQSLRTYREVLNDPDFGQLFVGGARPERWSHVFASIQSLNAGGVDAIPGSSQMSVGS